MKHVYYNRGVLHRGLVLKQAVDQVTHLRGEARSISFLLKYELLHNDHDDNIFCVLMYEDLFM